MVVVEHEPDEQAFFVYFGGPQFDELLGFVKKIGLRYDSARRAWTGPAYIIYKNLREIGDIDSIDVSDSVYTALEKAANRPSEIRKWRMPTEWSLLNFTPMQGKPPYENYQATDLKRIINTNRKGIFWSMGLGKGVVMVAALDQLFFRGMVEKVLVLAPSEGVHNWKREIKKFSSQIDIDRVAIGDRNNRKPFTDDVDVVIMTYRTFLMISDDYYKENTKGKGKAKNYRKPQIPFGSWGSEGKRALVADESHNLKNYSARQTKVTFLHAPYFEYRYLLTGTPADKVENYYTQIRLLDSSLIPEPYHEWISTMANVGDNFSNYNINYFYPEKVEEFVNRISPYIIRRKVEDHLDLPENYIEKIFVELTGDQKYLYYSIVEDTLKDLTEKNGYAATKQVVSRFPFMTLALDNPSILSNTDAEHLSDTTHKLLNKWKFTKHGKLPATESLITRYLSEGRKVILWSGHPQTIDDLSEYFSKYNPLKLHGQLNFGKLTRDQYRDQVVEKFKRSASNNLLIASYKVLNSAVTITEATRNVYFDRSYSLTEWLQSLKRTHRIGQSAEVVTNPIIFDDTLDVRLDHRLESKADIDKKLLSKDQLSVEEWKAIFEGEI